MNRLIQKGIKVDKQETLRTIRHIFRSLYVYFSIVNKQATVDLNFEFQRFLKTDLNHLYEINPDLFTYMLLYHDIGRPFNKEWHTFESAKLIQEKNLISKTDMPQKYITILIGAIKYHLLLGTIFTGESSYVGALVLLFDINLRRIWESEEETDLFFQILLLFSVVDILGYDYSKIYDHYLSYYLKIKKNLVNGFNHIRIIDNTEEKQKMLYNYFYKLDEENLKWRIACSLRIFQFVNTGPELTKEFYFRKIDQGLEKIGSNWDQFSKNLGIEHSLAQFKYALPLMMILASGSFSRKPIDKDYIVNRNIYKFWEVSMSKVKNYSKEVHLGKFPIKLWNFIFKFPRNWFLDENFLKIIQSKKFFSLIDYSIPKIDNALLSFQVCIDYKL